MKITISSLCCIAIIIGLFCLSPNFINSADAENGNKEIVGTWLCAFSDYDYSAALQFTEDGIIRIYRCRTHEGDTKYFKIAQYTYKDNTLTVDGNDYECYLVENGLIIYGLHTDGYYLYTRA